MIHRYSMSCKKNTLFHLNNINLIMIKHAIPVLEPRLPPSEWQLSKQGRRLSRVLADELLNYDPISIFSSKETKALATAEEIAEVLKLPILVLPDLHEHERTTTDWMDTEEIFYTNIKKLFEFPDAQIFGC